MIGSAPVITIEFRCPPLALRGAGSREVTIPEIGRLAHPHAIRAAAAAAEQIGYSSLWVLDRLLSPIEPRSAYPANARGRLPEETTLDFISRLNTRVAPLPTGISWPAVFLRGVIWQH